MDLKLKFSDFTFNSIQKDGIRNIKFRATNKSGVLYFGKVHIHLSSSPTYVRNARDSDEKYKARCKQFRDKYDLENTVIAEKAKMFETISKAMPDGALIPDFYEKVKLPAEFDVSGDYGYLVELVRAGDIAISAEKFKNKDSEEKRKIMLSIATNLKTLHSLGILHGDLKPQNIIICRKGANNEGILIDFDLAADWNAAKKMDSTRRMNYFSLAGTDGYIAPEHRRADPDEPKDIGWIAPPIDVFALGITFLTYLRGDKSKVLIEGKAEAFISDIEESILCGYDFSIDPNSKLTPLEYALVCWMIAEDVSERATIDQVVKVLESESIALVPEKFRRNDPFFPWASDNIEFCLDKKPAVLMRGNKQGVYRLQRTEGSKVEVLKADKLVEEEYAKYMSTPPPPTPSDVGLCEPWETDKIKLISTAGIGSISRGSKETRYAVTTIGKIKKPCTADMLVEEGYAIKNTDLKNAKAEVWKGDPIKIRKINGIKIIQAPPSARGKRDYLIEQVDGTLRRVGDFVSLLDEKLADYYGGIVTTPWDGDSVNVTGLQLLARNVKEGKGYVVCREDRFFTLTAKELKAFCGDSLAEVVTSPDVWESDHIVLKNDVNVKKTGKEGWYRLYIIGAPIKILTAVELVKLGYAVDVKDVKKVTKNTHTEIDANTAAKLMLSDEQATAFLERGGFTPANVKAFTARKIGSGSVPAKPKTDTEDTSITKSGIVIPIDDDLTDFIEEEEESYDSKEEEEVIVISESSEVVKEEAETETETEIVKTETVKTKTVKTKTAKTKKVKKPRKPRKSLSRKTRNRIIIASSIVIGTLVLLAGIAFAVFFFI